MWEDEAAVSICAVKFQERPGEQFVLVGTATGMKLGDRSTEGCIHTYSVSGNQLTLLHKTTVEAVPRAMCPFQGRVLVGTGMECECAEEYLFRARMADECACNTAMM
jgi:splicing factor 3B subunit 3